MCVLHLCKQERQLSSLCSTELVIEGIVPLDLLVVVFPDLVLCGFFFILDPGCYCNSILVDEKCNADISSTCLLV